MFVELFFLLEIFQFDIRRILVLIRVVWSLYVLVFVEFVHSERLNNDYRFQRFEPVRYRIKIAHLTFLVVISRARLLVDPDFEDEMRKERFRLVRENDMGMFSLEFTKQMRSNQMKTCVFT